MQPASFLDVFVAVIAANGVTAWIVYCLWRMNRRDDDHRANFTFVALLAVVGLIVYASTSG